MQKLYQDHPIIKEAFEQPVIRQAQEQFRQYVADPVARDIERRHQEYLFLQQVGRKRDIKEGDYNRQIKDASRMKAKGYPVKEIAEITELSAGEIERL
jgi:predicted transposase/invertase (TIGR01784 family)